MKTIIKLYNKLKKLASLPIIINQEMDAIKINQGIQLVNNAVGRNGYKILSDLEFKVFSQFGDDGIIQYLIRNIDCTNDTFVEFGVGDYFESNTRFLLQKDNWSGFVMDGSKSNIERIKKSYFYWRHDLVAKDIFITKENINGLINDYCKNGVSLIHIDLDGNDYWIWKEIESRPDILILEYNSTFGYKRSITVPYDSEFQRSKAHYSNLYWGASLKALYNLCSFRGYSFLGCNSAGNNAYFVLSEKLNGHIKEVSLIDGFVKSKYRESRDKAGNLNYDNYNDRTKAIIKMPVYNTELNKMEEF